MKNKNYEITFKSSLFTIVGCMLILLKLIEYKPICELGWWIILMPFYLPVVILIIALIIQVMILEKMNSTKRV